MSSLQVRVDNDEIHIGPNFSFSFRRTLRIPDDGKTYALPPDLGKFPVCRVDDYLDRVPESWRKTGGVFIPMYQREAMWIRFNSKAQNAVKVAVGKVNAVSGETWSQDLRTGKNDYMVVPDQPWLDGINNGSGTIKQFIAMPLGSGYTVEGQVTGKEEHGGVQIIAFEAKKPHIIPIRHPKPTPFPPVVHPKPIFYPQPKPYYPSPPMYYAEESETADPFSGPTYDMIASQSMSYAACPPSSMGLVPESRVKPTQKLKRKSGGAEMGLGAGGQMKQKIYADKHGVDHWDQSRFGRVFVHIVNSEMFEAITGRTAPPTPVSQSTYAMHGLPWFSMYDENKSYLGGSSILGQVKSVVQIDKETYGVPLHDNTSLPKYQVRDGDW